ncbi:hypothetical protein [Paludisphaera mucosa]|uniref:Uncharacterized protein n=1 Tax=Paludisphaera mucosa TaxID=3030827 RepID=A0ABT6FJG7_9BACT|nr:hypothetical protein [Paludisphaera mucosa]MDG3007689.1 hypothetical protein [Paludisphaera mucosa]
MAFHYTTEYRLGRRGTVHRTYGGLRALLAIGFDLALALVFGLIEFGLLAAWFGVVAVYRVAVWGVATAFKLAVALLGLPLRLARAVSGSGSGSGRAPAKPALALFEDF